MQATGTEWSVVSLWRGTNALERAVLVVLAFMLIRVVAMGTDCCYRYRSAALAKALKSKDDDAKRRIATELSLKLGSLRSIFTTAPYLGLVGSCSGILSIFRGYDGTKFGLVVMMVSGIEIALVSTAAGILATLPAVCSYNYLRTRKDLLEGKMHSGPLEKVRFPLRARFSAFPFSAILASTLAVSLAAFMIFPSFRASKGLAVRLLKIGALEGERLGERVVITVGSSNTNNSPVLYVNSKKTAFNELEKELRVELEGRPLESVAYVQAEDGALWRDVVNVIDAAQRLHAQVVLLTATPAVH